MWKRTEFRYETMMSMAMFVEAGIWKIRDEDDRPATKEEVLAVFQEAFLLTIGKEASGAYGFNPSGSFSSIEVVEDENGIDIEARCTRNALRAIVDGLWGSIEGERFCLDIEGMGLDNRYFRYLPRSTERYIPVADILNGAALNAPNVRRFVAMLCSRPFAYGAHLADEKGIGLLDYPEELREKTIKAAFKLG